MGASDQPHQGSAQPGVTRVYDTLLVTLVHRVALVVHFIGLYVGCLGYVNSMGYVDYGLSMITLFVCFVCDKN